MSDQIINEIPAELEGEEVEVKMEGTENVEVAPPNAIEKVEQEPKLQEEDLLVEEEDDTPIEDRNRDPLPQKVVDEIENDTLEDYSERVKQRMAQLKKVWHDERRAKEAAEREKEEAVRFARNVSGENNNLKQTLSVGEEEYIKALQDSSKHEMEVAKRNYSDAYETGETDLIVEAQTQMNEAQYKLNRAESLKPKYSKQKALQDNEKGVKNELQPRVPVPDARAQEWQAKNNWFGKDEEMTSLALGLHEKLVRSGIDPSSDVYYRRIDETMQKRFPENFGDSTLEQDKPSQRKPSTVVAPATRTTAPKKIRLSKTQVALARKLKLTPEQYAREMMKLENANG
jgi:hypothetical protein|tara:strand:+ start:6672 stop:7700 length:1029 start_codon:yes stop_codon:yes gene_type:complete